MQHSVMAAISFVQDACRKVIFHPEIIPWRHDIRGCFFAEVLVERPVKVISHVLYVYFYRTFNAFGKFLSRGFVSYPALVQFFHNVRDLIEESMKRLHAL